MAEVIGIAFLAALSVVAGFWLTRRGLPRTERVAKQDYEGTWREIHETVAARDHSLTRVVLVREHNGYETGRLEVATISSNDPDWEDKMLQAQQDAARRKAILDSGR